MGELDMWIAAAKIIHTYVELEVDKPVNVHHFGECGEAYAKVFGVYPRKLNFGAEMFPQMNGFHPF